MKLKSAREINDALRLLAKVAADDGRHPSDRTVATNAVIALGWVTNDVLTSAALDELLDGWRRDYA